MSIDEKLDDLKISKILLVDDTPENISAAKKYFANQGVDVHYESSAQSAIDQLRTDSYDFILTDLEMETETSGYDVIAEGLRQYTNGVIVTGRNYDRSDGAAHGPDTQILPIKQSVKVRKNDSRVWEQLFEKSLEYMTDNDQRRLQDSMNRLEKFGVGMDEILISLKLSTYKS